MDFPFFNEILIYQKKKKIVDDSILCDNYEPPSVTVIEKIYLITMEFLDIE